MNWNVDHFPLQSLLESEYFVVLWCYVYDCLSFKRAVINLMKMWKSKFSYRNKSYISSLRKLLKIGILYLQLKTCYFT